MTSLGRTLRAHRAKHGMSQADLALALHVTQAMVSDLEGGQRDPSAELDERIRRVLAGAVGSPANSPCGCKSKAPGGACGCK